EAGNRRGAGLDGLVQDLGGAALALAPGFEDEAAEGAIVAATAARIFAIEEEIDRDLRGIAGDLANLGAVLLDILEGDKRVRLGEIENQAQILRGRQFRGRTDKQEIAGRQD